MIREGLPEEVSFGLYPEKWETDVKADRRASGEHCDYISWLCVRSKKKASVAGAWEVKRMCRMDRRGHFLEGSVGKSVDFTPTALENLGGFHKGNDMLLEGDVFGVSGDGAVMIWWGDGELRY